LLRFGQCRSEREALPNRLKTIALWFIRKYSKYCGVPYRD
jgi:hypothetical protein